MKNVLLNSITKLSLLVLIAMMGFTFTACEEDEEENGDEVIVLDGIYIKGDATALAELDDNGQFSTTKNEVIQEERSSLYEKYIAISGTGGFNIVQVAGDEVTTYGPGSDFAKVPDSEKIGDEPQGDFWRGTYSESEETFSVPSDGLYHVVIDTELGKVVVAEVNWGVIGAATEGGWSASTSLPSQGFDKNEMTFEGTQMTMNKGDFKFRYSSGWKIVLDTVVDLGEGNKGVRVNTNYGGSVSSLDPGGANINNDTPGYYTVTMTWTLGEGHSASMEKTGDLPLTDYSDYEMGLIGDGIVVDDAPWGWDATYDKKTPTVDGTVYTWTWDAIEVTADGSFKIRQGDDWEGFILGYPQVTMAGSAADDFSGNDDGNFVPASDATYDLQLDVDASDESYTLTVEPTSK